MNIWIYRYSSCQSYRILLGWLAGCGPGSPAITVSTNGSIFFDKFE